jgi:hypothetical protein
MPKMPVSELKAMLRAEKLDALAAMADPNRPAKYLKAVANG